MHTADSAGEPVAHVHAGRLQTWGGWAELATVCRSVSQTGPCLLARHTPFHVRYGEYAFLADLSAAVQAQPKSVIVEATECVQCPG